MTKQAWTPGPWRIGDAGFTVFGPKTEAPSPRTVCKLVSHGEREANAQLIALAPEMAEALRAIDGLMECETYDPQDVQAMMTRVSEHVDSILSRLPVAK